MAKEYKRWKIGNIGYIVGRQGLKWQQIGNTIGNNRQQSDAGRAIGELARLDLIGSGTIGDGLHGLEALPGDTE